MIGAENIAYLQHDNYYFDRSHLSAEDRISYNFDHPDSLDTSLLIRQLRDLRQARTVEVPIYDFATHARQPFTQTLKPARVILIEGVLIFVEKALRQLMDLRIYVDTDTDLRFIRRLQRDIQKRGWTVNSVIDQYLTNVRPMHLEFVETSKHHADVIIPEGGGNQMAITVIASHIQTVLSKV